MQKNELINKWHNLINPFLYHDDTYPFDQIISDDDYKTLSTAFCIENDISKGEFLKLFDQPDVKTNMGNMPMGDYFDIVAMQNGFDSYEELLREGYSL